MKAYFINLPICVFTSSVQNDPERLKCIPLIVQMYHMYINIESQIALSILIDQFEFIYRSKCVSCEMRYTKTEKIDMIFIYGECRQIMREAIRLYAKRFSDLVHPSFIFKHNKNFLRNLKCR